jgi:hypothetical protein
MMVERGPYRLAHESMAGKCAFINMAGGGVERANLQGKIASCNIQRNRDEALSITRSGDDGSHWTCSSAMPIILQTLQTIQRTRSLCSWVWGKGSYPAVVIIVTMITIHQHSFGVAFAQKQTLHRFLLVNLLLNLVATLACGEIIAVPTYRRVCLLRQVWWSRAILHRAYKNSSLLRRVITPPAIRSTCIESGKITV